MEFESPKWLQSAPWKERVAVIDMPVSHLLEHESFRSIEKRYEGMTNKLTHDRRRHDFLAGRMAMHLLCERLGNPIDLIEADQQGMPIFPFPLKGSLSHSGGHLVAMMSVDLGIRSIGIDLEGLVPLERAERLQQKIGTTAEFTRLTALLPADLGFTILFAAKEALFKAVYPLVKCMFWFEDASLVEIHVPDRTVLFKLDGRLCKSQPSMKMVTVSWRPVDAAIMATCVLEA